MLGKRVARSSGSNNVGVAAPSRIAANNPLGPSASSLVGVLFRSGKYPTQTTQVTAQTYDGEYRGYFPGMWKPESSRFGSRPNNPHGHGGIDIYAPYAPHPVETPLLAPIDGAVVWKTAALEPNMLGNRVAIVGTINGEKRQITCGHLSRFAGHRDRASKGAVIGYAGCTGNANTQGECKACGDCNVNSGHVHLAVFKDGIQTDPIAETRMTLRFSEGDPLARTENCSTWGPMNGLGAKWEPPGPDPDKSQVVVTQLFSWIRKNGKRVPLPLPFEPIEFDVTTAMTASLAAYKMAGTRLTEIGQPAVGPAGAQRRKFLTSRRDAAEQALRSCGTAIAEMRQRIIMARAGSEAVIGLDDTARAPGYLLRHISTLTQMLWHLSAGPAFDQLCSNQLSDTVEERYTSIGARNLRTTFAGLLSETLVESGAGIGGTAWLSAADEGCNALHVTRLPGQTDEIVSITFGAGSLMHATVSRQMRVAPADLPTTAGGTSLNAYLDALMEAVAKLRALFQSTVELQVRLSGSTADTQARIDARVRIAALIKEACSACERCATRLANEAPIAPLLLARATAANVSIFEQMIARSRSPEGATFVKAAPDMFALELRAPQ